MNFFVSFDVVRRRRVVNVVCNLRADVDNAQRINHVARAVRFAEFAAFDEVTGKIDVRAELSGKFERLNQAIEHRVAPIKTSFAQFNGAFGNSRPIRTFIAKRMRQIDQLIIRLQLIEKIPQLVIHLKSPFF